MFSVFLSLSRYEARGRDNELFVLLVDFLEIGPDLDKVVRAVRVALGRHHQVLVVCPWPAGVDLPTGPHGKGKYDQSGPSLQDLLSQASTLRLHQAFHVVKKAFARIGVPVLCAPAEEAVGVILQRMQRLRNLQRGTR